MARTAVVCAVLLLTAREVAAQPATTGPQITIAAHQVTVSGITPGADVVLLGDGMQPKATYAAIVKWSALVTDDDKDGTVVLKTTNEVPAGSVWAAVDARNGRYAILSPEGAVSQLPRANRLRKSPAGDVDRFAFPRSRVDAIYVHPGLGAWLVRGADGTATDADGHPNRTTVVSLDRARSLTEGDQRPPRAFAPGGVLIAIDEQSLSITVIEIDAAAIGGAQ